MLEGSGQADSDSYYGSDFDEDEKAQLRQLLESAEARDNNKPLVRHDDVERYGNPNLAHIPISPGLEHLQRNCSGERLGYSCSIVADQARCSIFTSTSNAIALDKSPGRIRWATEDPRLDTEDRRTPLERFRTAPKKPLSVTDFVSPAWCELQYWYNLVKHGKVKQTLAMKRGSEVHRSLEDEVHETAFVDVQTKEDAWGLKIWNIIQGLRTLRATGLTRELELWGIINGEVINGIIDEISFSCTDPELERSVAQCESSGSGESQESSDQTTITGFFTLMSGEPSEGPISSSSGMPQQVRKLYLTDVKTRGSRILPSKIAMQPTELQLMLYRRLLTEMAANRVDTKILFRRYSLNASERFSDSLIAQLSALEFNSPTQTANGSNATIESQTDTVVELLTHNSLSKLWSLMVDEFQKTMTGRSISNVLRAQFRSSKDGSIIGAKTFPYEEDRINDYVAEEMRWWNGQREARGVDVEEAFKCRTCDFADECTWRLSKVKDALSASKERVAARKNSSG